LGPLNNYWTFSFENHHQLVKKDVEKHSPNIAITSFNLNYNFIETIYNKISCRKNILKLEHHNTYEQLLIDKKIINKMNFAVEINKNKIGLILEIIKLKTNNKIILKILPRIIKIEDLSNFYEIDKTKNFGSYFINFNDIKTIHYIQNTGDKTFLIMKIINYNIK
jgi:hypothetical protein